MAKVKPAHYRGSYHKQSRKVRDAAKANPSTRCWRCGRTLVEHPRHANGRAPYWTAGHVNDAQVGGELRAEASVCNFGAGAERRETLHGRRNQTTREW